MSSEVGPNSPSLAGAAYGLPESLDDAQPRSPPPLPTFGATWTLGDLFLYLAWLVNGRVATSNSDQTTCSERHNEPDSWVVPDLSVQVFWAVAILAVWKFGIRWRLKDLREIVGAVLDDLRDRSEEGVADLLRELRALKRDTKKSGLPRRADGAYASGLFALAVFAAVPMGRTGIVGPAYLPLTPSAVASIACYSEQKAKASYKIQAFGRPDLDRRLTANPNLPRELPPLVRDISDQCTFLAYKFLVRHKRESLPGNPRPLGLRGRRGFLFMVLAWFMSKSMAGGSSIVTVSELLTHVEVAEEMYHAYLSADPQRCVVFDALDGEGVANSTIEVLDQLVNSGQAWYPGKAALGTVAYQDLEGRMMVGSPDRDIWCRWNETGDEGVFEIFVVLETDRRLRQIQEGLAHIEGILRKLRVPDQITVGPKWWSRFTSRRSVPEPSGGLPRVVVGAEGKFSVSSRRKHARGTGST